MVKDMGNRIRKAIKNGVYKIEQAHKELTIYTSQQQFKDEYIIGQFDGDIGAIRMSTNYSDFFTDDGDYPDREFYILYTTCCNDDEIYTDVQSVNIHHYKYLNCTEQSFLNAVEIYLNYGLEPESFEDDEEYLNSILEFGAQ